MVLGLHKGNYSATDIEKILKIPRTACIDIINKFERDQTVSNAPCSGRPPLLKVIDKRHFIRTITEKFNSLGLTQISTKTARRVLREQGYSSRIDRRTLVSEKK